MAYSPKRVLLAGLIEQESCVSLKHSRCWNPASKLKNSREEGAGLGQVTRAWTSTGELRFDKLAELRTRYPSKLGEMHWSTIYKRPDLQIRALVLQHLEIYKTQVKRSSDVIEALAFTDAAYNGGERGLSVEQRACYISKTCDPSKWFKNVERFCMKSKVPLYGNRSACDINREHVRGTFSRSVKYSYLFKGI